ncbi:MAG: hypothetical protein JWN01_1005 [Patescibacteria group bacterium]|nr:hypothetical protein [Patescibacteria group bacterium]
MSNLLKKEKGFTLIEIVLVLAIAGLLMVIVFLAVSGAQKSRRDTQRKNDIGRIAAALENYASNTNGTYPASAAVAGAALQTYLPAANFLDPQTGDAYGSATPAGPLTFTTGTGSPGGLSYTLSGARTYTVCVGLEQGGQACRTNQ